MAPHPILEEINRLGIKEGSRLEVTVFKGLNLGETIFKGFNMVQPKYNECMLKKEPGLVFIGYALLEVGKSGNTIRLTSGWDNTKGAEICDLPAAMDICYDAIYSLKKLE